MTTKTFITIVALSGAVVGAVEAWRSHGTTLQLDREITALANRRTALSEAARRLEDQIAAEQNHPAYGQPTTDPSAVRLRPLGNAQGSPNGLAAGDPELHARALETFKVGLRANYAEFYRTLALTETQITEFETLMVEREGRRRDILAAEPAVRIDPTAGKTRDAITSDGRQIRVSVDSAIAALRREDAVHFETAMTAALGENGYARLKTFDRSAESRRVVNELVRNLSFGPAPLANEQGNQLVAILQEANYRAAIAPENNHWEEILGRARVVLTLEQSEEFEALIAKLRRDAARNPLQRAVQEWLKASRNAGRSEMGQVWFHSETTRAHLE
jgi:hypothetical protein